jgi:glucose/arabinose dehydrogenase
MCLSSYSAIVLLFLVFLGFILFINNQIYTDNAYGLISAASIQNNSSNIPIDSPQTQFYACTDYDDIIHCDPSVSRVTSFFVDGISSKVYTPSGKLVIVEGKYGNALKMQANRQESIEINDTKSISPQNFSVTFWAKRLAESEPVGVIISHSNDTNTAGWYFQMLSNGNVSFAVTNSDGNVIQTEDTDVVIPLDKFTYIAGTFDGSKVRLYKDGQLASESIFEGEYIPDSKTPLRIGGIAGNMGKNLWTGIIDDFTLSNKTLTDNQVKEIFLSNTASLSPNTHNTVTEGLISNLDFDKNLTDISLTHHENDGTLRTLIASMAFAPDGRLFFSEKNTGNIKIMKDDKVVETPFATISDYYVNWEQGLLGLAIDPLFEKNHYVYLYYTANDSNKIINKLVRFTEVNNSAYDKVTLLDNIPALPGYHSGGALAFGPDDKLYIGIGDATTSIFAQNPSVLLGKVLRINRDGTIPADNPYHNSPVYTMGHRNIYGMAFDNNSSFGIIAENGDSFYDEINLIMKGGNYGFPTLQPPNIAPETTNSSLSILPLRSYWKPVGPTQTIYYEGNKFPELKNRFLVGGFDGNIYALTFDPKNNKITEEEKIVLNLYPYSATTALAMSPNGDIYFAGYDIYKLLKIDSSRKEQIVFPVELNFSTPFNRINSIQVLQGQNKMLIDFQTSNGNNTEKSASSPFTLSIKIPKKLLDVIYSVVNASNNANNKNNIDKTLEPINYTIDNTSSHFNTISVKYQPSMTYQLEITGGKEAHDVNIGGSGGGGNDNPAHSDNATSYSSNKPKTLPVSSVSNPQNATSTTTTITTTIDQIYNTADNNYTILFPEIGPRLIP